MKRAIPYLATALMLILALAPGQARAEATEVNFAKQYGIAYLQLMVMEDQGLVEKHAKQAGLPLERVSWNTFTGGAAGKPAEACIKSALMKAKVQPFAEPTYTANVTVRHN